MRRVMLRSLHTAKLLQTPPNPPRPTLQEIHRDVLQAMKLVGKYAKEGKMEEALKEFDKTNKENPMLWTTIISAYTKSKKFMDALKFYGQMRGTHIQADNFTFPCVLKACASLKDKNHGKQIHSHVIIGGFQEDIYVCNALIDMYSKCCSLGDACQVFDKMPNRDVVSWNALISGHTWVGNLGKALELLNHLKDSYCEPNLISWNIVIVACARNGKVTTMLELVNQMENSGIVPDLITWNTIISGFAQIGDLNQTLYCINSMVNKGIRPDSVTLSAILPCVGKAKDIAIGKGLHCFCAVHGFVLDLFVGNALIDMYAKCGCMNYARMVFEKMTTKDVVSWTSVVLGYLQCGEPYVGLGLFERMKRLGIKPNVVTWNGLINSFHENGEHYRALEMFSQLLMTDVRPNSTSVVSVFNVCSHLRLVKPGEAVHGYGIKSNLLSDIMVGNALVDMYAKSGCLEVAKLVFDEMEMRDVVSYNALMVGYAQWGRSEAAVRLFEKMRKIGLELTVFSWTAMISALAQSGDYEHAFRVFREMHFAEVSPNSVTIASILPVCTHSGGLRHGKSIHGLVIKYGFDSDVNAGNALIDMYAKCGSMEDAHMAFEHVTVKDDVTWNTLIAGCAHKGQDDEALKLFEQMKIAGIQPSVISWTSLIAGLSQHGNCTKALKAFCDMQLENLQPDSVTLASVLPACAQTAALKQGKEIHGRIIRFGFDSDVFTGSALIDMYAKCGNLFEARSVFDKMRLKNAVAWNAMIVGYAMHGHGTEALSLFSQMESRRIRPDNITFTGIISACSHAGLVQEGRWYFSRMSQAYGITPKVEQYACIVDLLGRAGHLDEAYDFITKMPIEPSASVWSAFIGACRIYRNVEMATFAAEKLVELEPRNASIYVMLSNIYAASGKWSEVAEIRKKMKDLKIKKQPGWSWIEVGSKVHKFYAGYKRNSETDIIYKTLEDLTRKMKLAGYVHNTDFALHNVGEEEKEGMLSVHSEKLAIAFGIVNTRSPMPIRVIKNLRVCGDCHTATKFISKLAGREIIVRDAHRFHHFKNGVCSCGDYW